MKRSLIGLAGVILLILYSHSAQAANLYFNNFEANSNGFTGAGFLAGSQGFSGYGFGTQYLRNSSGGNPAASSKLNLTLGTAASGSSLDFDLAVLDSWDGDAGFNCCGPDIFNVNLDGSSIYSRTFNIFNGTPATDSHLTTLVYGPDLAVNGWGDQGYHVNLSLGNLAPGAHTIEFFASGSGWQAGDDESFAVDNVAVNGTQQRVPEPSALYLMVVGLGGLGLAVRRRLA